MDHHDDDDHGGGDDDDRENEYGDANGDYDYGDDDFQRLFFIVFRAEKGDLMQKGASDDGVGRRIK